MQQQLIALDGPLSLKRSFSKLQQGRFDPCTTWTGDVFWRATRTPEGPATVRLEMVGDRLRVSAWGPGATWVQEGAPRLCGADQTAPLGHPMLDDLNQRLPGLRAPRTAAVFEAMLYTVLAQRVTSLEAVTSYRRLAHHFGCAAPPVESGPSLLLPPSPDQIAGLPSWAFHRFGVERHRAEALRVVAKCARRLEETAEMTTEQALRRMTALPGIGRWTAAEVAQVALGDADAVSAGDFHLKNQVSWALAGEARGTDERMLELLVPFTGRRGHVVRLITHGHPRPPKFGPRYSPLPLAAM